MRRLLLASVLLAAGCGTTEPTAEPDVTWHADVQPLVAQHCIRCHREGGNAPVDFSSYETVRDYSATIWDQVSSGQMPPAAADPDCHTYQGADHFTLDDEETATLSRWVELGAPEGDPATAVSVEVTDPELSDPDMVLTIPAAYRPTYADPANPANEYRCFVLDPEHDESFFIEAMHPVIDEEAIVHHIVLFAMDRSAVPGDYDPAMGVDCIDGDGFGSSVTEGMLAAWAPGMLPIEFPEGMGLRVGVNQVIGIQMHYYDNAGPDASDQSGFAFRTTDSVDQTVFMAPLGTYDFRIPAGDPEYSHSDGFALPISVDILGTFPHMHVLGSGYRAWIDGDDGERCIVESDRYNFDNQMTYMFDEPIRIESGERVNLECTWDNSTGNPARILDTPVDTYYGERTDEEMCFAFTFVTAAR